MEICVSFLSQLRRFISNRCFSPLISGRKPASLNLQPLDTARQAEGQSSNSCTGDTAYAGAAVVFLNKQKQRREKEIDELPCKYCCTNTPNWWSCSFASCLVTAKTHTEHDSAKVTLVLSATIKSFGCPLCLTGIQFAADSWYDLQCGVTKICDTHTWPVTWLNWSPQILG